jgi:hypothetical protein
MLDEKPHLPFGLFNELGGQEEQRALAPKHDEEQQAKERLAAPDPDGCQQPARCGCFVQRAGLHRPEGLRTPRPAKQRAKRLCERRIVRRDTPRQSDDAGKLGGVLNGSGHG